MNLIGAAAIVLSVIAFAMTYNGLRSRPMVVRIRWFLGFAVLSVPSLLFAIYFLFATVTTILVPWEDIAAWPLARGTGGAFGGFAGGLAGLLLGLLTLARVRRGGGP